MAWTEDRVEVLKKLWAEGLSASQIANRLGGVTRNAVIGKVHRLGLSGRATTSRAKAPRPRRRLDPKTDGQARPHLPTNGAIALKPIYDEEPEADVELAPSPVEDLVVPISQRATIISLKESMCRWPIGDPGDKDFHFCGRSSPPGIPYCEHHAQIAYQPVHARRRDRSAAAR